MKTKFQEGDTVKIINSECKNEYYQNLIGKTFVIDKIDLKYADEHIYLLNCPSDMGQSYSCWKESELELVKSINDKIKDLSYYSTLGNYELDFVGSEDVDCVAYGSNSSDGCSSENQNNYRLISYISTDKTVYNQYKDLRLIIPKLIKYIINNEEKDIDEINLNNYKLVESDNFVFIDFDITISKIEEPHEGDEE